MKKDSKEFRKFLYTRLYWATEIAKVAKDESVLTEMKAIEGDCLAALKIPA